MESLKSEFNHALFNGDFRIVKFSVQTLYSRLEFSSDRYQDGGLESLWSPSASEEYYHIRCLPHLKVDTDSVQFAGALLVYALVVAADLLGTIGAFFGTLQVAVMSSWTLSFSLSVGYY